MTDNMKIFLKYLSKSPVLKQKLKGLIMCDNAEAVYRTCEAAKEEGLELTQDDFFDSIRTEEEYEEVVVGKDNPIGCYCVKTGAGDGVRKITDGIYSCSCVSFGEGADSEKYVLNCVCATFGEGDDTDL